MPQSKIHVRLFILAGVALLWMTATLGRLAYLQVVRHAEYVQRAKNQQVRTIEITPKRGAIYDRNMQPLAMSIPVQSAFASPGEVKDVDLASRLLSGVLDIPNDVVRKKLDSNSTFIWIQRKLPPEKVQAISALNLKGIYFQEENQRYYPSREMAAHILGFVDVDEHGLGGIEHEFDELIRGKGSKIVVMADARQRWFDGGEAHREQGASVILTIDNKIQYIAERELEAAIERTHAPAGTIIVQDPNTGAILALANWPNYNPNAATDVESEKRMDRAVSAVYEPGSTFKLVTLAAAFDQRLIRPDEVFNCENGSIVVAGHRIHDHKAYGMLTVGDILANSSDVGAIKIAQRLGPQRFYDYIRAFGFGQYTGIDLPGESRGILRKLNKWGSFSIGSISMGQEVGVTPVQMVTAVSSIANGGLLYRPHVVQEIRRGEQVLTVEGVDPNREPKQIIQPETAATMRQLMEGVVLHGTGKLARLDGWTAAGKTGTAQKIDPDTGRYSPNHLIASFTGFAPINNPAVTILVSLDSPVGPHEGGMVAAPVFKRVAEQVLPYLYVPRDVPLNPRLIQTAYQQTPAADSSSIEDFTPTDFPPHPDDATNNAKAFESAIPQVTIAVDEGGDIAVPDFKGKTMREVSEACFRLGLEPVLVGSSRALRQSPAAGSKVHRGTRVTVEFSGVPTASGRAN